VVRIAVVGAGASGVLLASNLRRTIPSAAIQLIEKRDQPGRGVAYSTTDPRHLLNVRVSNMSAFPDDPDHFFRWLQEHGPALGLGRPTHFCFVPRAVYGSYLSGLIESSPEGQGVELVNGECTDASEHEGGVRLTLTSGVHLDADICILATGNDLRSATLGAQAVIPWQPGALEALNEDDPVLIVGTGLTMVDVAVSLARSGHRGPITAISRRGLRPSTHRAVTKWSIDRASVPFGASVSRLTRWLRALAGECEDRGGDWRSVVDAIRPFTTSLWTAMSLDDRRRFLRHARPWWDAHRHRMAPSVAETVENLIAEGRLRLVPARILSCEALPASTRITYRRRGATATEVIDAERVFDCTGVPEDLLLTANPLIRALLARGHVRPDPLGLGLDVSSDCSLVDAAGRASRRLFAVGPISRATFWEIVAIPDIRVQCAELADRIAARVPAASPV